MFPEKLFQFLRPHFVPRNKLIILNFHQASPAFNALYNHPYIWSSLDFFKKQMAYLKENYEIISLQRGFDELREDKLKGTKIALTFDDGDKSVGTYIAPYLTEQQIPATFFINSAYPAEKKGYWFNIYHYMNHKNLEFESQELSGLISDIRNTLNPLVYKKNVQKVESLESKIEEKNPFYMEMDYWENINSDLFNVGLHGHEHYRFSMLNGEDKKMNLQKNLEAISGFKSFIPFVALPHGKPLDWDTDSIEEIKRSGLIPLLANGGYNVNFKKGILLRFSVDNVDLRQLLQNLSPFPRRYYRMNNLN